ncbi:hypothetical protein [uncultured Chryseobacterium sp.]|uniref:hypothetical protein n=1 Tax=uncultured Chryseobacterium sp. TaxID=259322 RepID=UPI0025E661EE|nr:hypothetical protein [uncultured Chryseobacterium sp.]
MKNIITALCLTLIVSCQKKEDSRTNQNHSLKERMVNQKPSDTVSYARIKTIDDIKKEYAVLNTLLISKKLDSSSFTYHCEKTGREGEAVFYYFDKQLKMVKNFYSENSHFSSSTKYFIKDNQVFFILNEETVWNFDDGGTAEKPETKDDIKEQRLYYINDRLEYCRDKEYTLRTKNHLKPENVSDGESKNCTDTELKKTLKILLENKDRKEKIQCL